MPEGDSLYRLAAKLAPVLVGRTVTSLRARRIPDDAADTLVGRRIEVVEAHGKNLLIRFDDGRVIHIHLKMNGRMFVERPRSAFWKPLTTIPDFRLVVPGASVLGKDLPVCRLLSSLGARQSPDLAALGPDLTNADYDADEARRRLRGLGDRTIAEALLAQRAAAGIGNVYKSEVLFLEGVDPRTPVAHLPDACLDALVTRASVLLRRNLGTGPRTTKPTLGGARLWVYNRGGRACFRCGTPVTRIMLGPEGGRSTYFCTTCQPAKERAL